MVKRVYQHRARWTARRLRPLIRPKDRILDVGAGDCRLDLLLQRQMGCEVVPVDVADYNQTDLPLTLFDGDRLPFEADSFDVVLLVFVLHHALDPRTVLEEARRVSRRQIVVFEDVNRTWWDRLVFRGFHRWLEWSQRIPRPYHEWPPERWSSLAADLGLHEYWSGLVGRQLGYFASRHIVFDWENTEAVTPLKLAG
jgi:ubiquinone/menaquinone biosynthesis C-methylase UbiE